MAVTEISTFFAAGANFIRDAAGNLMIPISNTSGRMADLVTPDIVGPILTNFSLNLDENLLILTFDEVVNVQTLDVTQIFLQNSDVMDDSFSVLSLNTSMPLQYNHYIVVVILSDSDKERIDVDESLATASNTTYINITYDGVRDVSNNPIEAFNESIPVGVFIIDSTGPTIVEFSLDLNSGVFDIFFSEAIVNFRILDINVTSSRRNLPVAPIIHVLDSTPVPISGPSSILSLQLSASNLNALKFDPFLSSNNDTEVNYPFNSFQDVYDNPTLGGSLSHPPTPDRNRPAVLAFDLDMNSNLLSLVFNETVEIGSLDLSAVTIQNDATAPTSSVQLTSPESTVLVGFSVVEIVLSIGDVDRIKSLQDLAVSNDTTFISISEGLVNDTAQPMPNVNTEVLGLRVANFIPDTTELNFLRFDLNLTTNTLILYFDEPVDISSFTLTVLTLLDIDNNNVSFSVLDAQIPSTNTKTVEIMLLQSDVNVLNILPICTSQEDCYLNLTDMVAVDTVGNPVNFTVDLPVRVDMFGVDTVPPELVQFQELDLNVGQLTITFSETVFVNTAMPMSLNLTNWYEDRRRTITLQLDGNATVLSNNGPTLVIQLSTEDLNIIKLPSNRLCTDDQFCWIRFDSSFIQDAFANPIVPIIDQSFVDSEFVDVIVPDTTPPVLLGFSLDMNATLLSFTFDEVVTTSVGFFTPRAITIQDSLNSSSSVSLATSTSDDLVLPSLPTELVLNISDTDVIFLQQDLIVATSINTTWLIYTEFFAADIFLNRIVPTFDEINATMAQDYIADSIRPNVIAFRELSYVTNSFSVEFSEPVLADSYESSRFIIHSQSQDGLNYTLTAGNTSLVPDSRTLLVFFSEFDVTELKRTDGITDDQLTTYIEIVDGGVTDTAGNLVIGTRDASDDPIAIVVDSFVQDVVPPSLTCFSLDMNIGFMQLTFDDVINPRTFMPVEMMLIETSDFSTSRPENQFQFTAGFSPSRNGFVVDFTILESDLNELKRRDGLATNYSDTFLRVLPLTIMDTGGLSATLNVLQVCDFIPDTTEPILTNWISDGNTGSISLLFSEAVNISSLDPTGITLQNSETLLPDSQYFVLTGGRTFPNVTDIMFQLFFTFEDFSAIQERTDLLTDPSNSYLALERGSILDQTGNEVEEILPSNAIQADLHGPDMVNPRLQYFTFDLNEGTLLLTFSESVNVSSLNASLFSLANGGDTSALDYVTYTLTGGTADVNDTELGMMGVSDHDVVVKLALTIPDLNSIKAIPSLGTSRVNTRLFFEEGASCI